MIRSSSEGGRQKSSTKAPGYNRSMPNNLAYPKRPSVKSAASNSARKNHASPGNSTSALSRAIARKSSLESSLLLSNSLRCADTGSVGQVVWKKNLGDVSAASYQLAVIL